MKYKKIFFLNSILQNENQIFVRNVTLVNKNYFGMEKI